MAGSCDDGPALGVARAYDAIASRYDHLLENDSWIRQVLWRSYDAAFGSGQHVMDLACGTGIDTIHLAGKGIRVTAIDASQGMLDQLEEKIRRLGLAALIEVRRCDIGALESGDFKEMDGIVSGFAGLNTIENLGGLVDNAASWLRPDGRMIVQLLTRDGVMGRSGARAECAANGATATITVCGQPVDHLCLPAREIYGRYFAHRFRKRRIYGLGYLFPAPLLSRMPGRLLPWIGRLEARVGGWGPLLRRSRFCIMDLERRPDPADRPPAEVSQRGKARP